MSRRINLRGLRDRIVAAAHAGVETSARQVADLAAQLAPVDTGALRRSIRAKPGTTPGTWIVTAGEGLPDQRAPAQEYGTVNQPAQPYMAPAVKAIKVSRNVRDAISAALRGR